MVEFPQHAKKRIYWGDGKAGSGRGVILVGYCPDTLAYFNALAAEAKKSFPDLTDDDIACGRVCDSPVVNQFTVIVFQVHGKKRKIAGWESYNCNIDFRY